MRGPRNGLLKQQRSAAQLDAEGGSPRNHAGHIRGFAPPDDVAHGNVYPELFTQFPPQGVTRCFTGFDLPTREFPAASIITVTRALSEKHPTVAHYASGDNVNRDFFRGLHLFFSQENLQGSLKPLAAMVSAARKSGVPPSSLYQRQETPRQV